MSDEKLRELERRWRETGTNEDEAAWLAERLRVGGLTRRSIELASFLGYQPSSELTNVEPERAWVRSVRDWGLQFAFTAMMIYIRKASEEAQPYWINAWWDDHRIFSEQLCSAEEWLSCPCPRHLKLLEEKFQLSRAEIREASRDESLRGTCYSLQRAIINMAFDDKYNSYGINRALNLISYSTQQRGKVPPRYRQQKVSQSIRHELIRRELGYECSAPILYGANEADQP